jgi:hypothetical protein
MALQDSKSGAAIESRHVNAGRDAVDAEKVSGNPTDSTHHDSMDMYRMGKLQELRVCLLR